MKNFIELNLGTGGGPVLVNALLINNVFTRGDGKVIITTNLPEENFSVSESYEEVKQLILSAQ